MLCISCDRSSTFYDTVRGEYKDLAQTYATISADLCAEKYIPHDLNEIERYSENNINRVVKNSRRGHASLLFLAGLNLLYVEEFQEALPIFEKATQLWPENMELVIGRLLALKMAGEDESILPSVRLLKNDDTLPQYIGAMLWAIGEYEDFEGTEGLSARELDYIRILSEIYQGGMKKK